MKRRTLILAAAAVPFIAACHPNSWPSEAPRYISHKASGLTTEDMERCIMAGGAPRNWRMKRVREGLITAVYQKHQYVAAVDIHYTAEGYEFKVNPLTTMKGEDAETNAQIVSGKYNQWTANLDKDIRTEIRKFTQKL